GKELCHEIPCRIGTDADEDALGACSRSSLPFWVERAFNDRGSSGSQDLGKIEHAISRIGTRDHDVGKRMADAALDGSARRLVIVGILTKDAGNQKRREE